MEEKQIKNLFKRINETPINKKEADKQVKEVLSAILGCQYMRSQEETLIDDYGEHDEEVTDLLNDSSLHRPRKQKKKKSINNEGPIRKRVRISLNSEKDELQCTVQGTAPRISNRMAPTKSKVMSKSRKNMDERILRTAWNTFCQLVGAVQTEIGVFKIDIEKGDHQRHYEVRVNAPVKALH